MSDENRSAEMKILGVILVAVGALNFVAAGFALYRDGSLPGGMMPAIMTALALAIGIGVIRKRIFAWILGFIFLAAAAFAFAAKVILFAAEKEGGERVVLLASGIAAPALVCGAFMIVWWRQRSYFSRRNSEPNQTPDRTRLDAARNSGSPPQA